LKERRIAELDLMRFIAALAVMLHHLFRRGWPIFPATRFGFLGVELFFMISGFVILWTSTSRTGYEFVASRVSRLYPTFWTCVLITFVMLWLAGTPASVPDLLANLTMLPRALNFDYLDYVYWTLQIEMLFYVAMFALIVTGQLRHIEWWLWAWIAVAAAAALLGLPDEGVVKLATLRGFAPFFVAGCTFYLIRMQGATRARFAILLLCVILGVKRALFSGDESHLLDDLTDRFILGAIVVVEFTAFLTLALKLWRIPDWKLWGILGAMTYPLYLLHYRNEQSLAPLLHASNGARVAIAAACALAGALLIALTIERHVCPAFNRWLLRTGEALHIYKPRARNPAVKSEPASLP
jgi:peptidoglycan/LPS O-acetylase OafA/YrhL